MLLILQPLWGSSSRPAGPDPTDRVAAAAAAAVAAAVAAAAAASLCYKGSLQDLLLKDSHEQLPWGQVMAMLLDAARGAQHLHDHGVLHR
jgi:hypothetical protein